MPKRTRYRLAWSSVDYRYDLYDDNTAVAIDDADWAKWLNEHSSFAFAGRSQRLNLLKERRKADYDYWYAYQRQGKKVAKRYPGRSANLTFAHLEAISQAMSSVDEQSVVPQPEELPANVGQAGSPTTAPLLASKFRLPHLTHNLVPRERLLAQLDAGQEGKLTLVSAPAGCGKTTLVRQWLDRVATTNPSTAVAWLSLDDNDNDLLRFWRYLIITARAFAPHLGDQSLASLDTASALQSPLETLPMVFANELENIQGKAILVLEDYHLITVPLIHETLSFLIDHLPPALHLVIITRLTPPLPLARLRALNDLSEIEAQDLRFSQAETSTFLKLNTDLPVARDDLHEVETQIEGWAAGLRLLSLALRGHQDQTALRLVLANFASGRREIGDYFVAEVLNNRAAALQQFLLETSFLSSLTASLCDSVTLRDDSQQMLEALETSNLFLAPLDGVGLWYRYHALFASAMQTEARRRFDETHIRTLIERAGGWYEAHRMLGEAIDAAFSANNILRAADLISAAVEREFATEEGKSQSPPEFYRIELWLAQLPQSMIDERPLLCLAAATATLFASMIEMRSLDSAEDTKIERGLQNAERGLQASAKTEWLGRVYAFRALFHGEQGRLTTAAQWANSALDLLPASEMTWRSSCIGIIGHLEEFIGHLESAAERFAEGRALCEQIGNHPFVRLYSITLARVYVEQNQPHQAEPLFTHVLDAAQAVGDIADISDALCGLAEISLSWNDLETAWSRAAEAVAVTQAQMSGYVDAVLILTRVELARGDHDAARARCEALLASRLAAKSLPEQQIRAQIAYMQAAIALSASDLNTVQRWRNHRFSGDHRLSDAELSRTRLEAEETLLAYLLLAENCPAEAVLRLEPLLADAEREGRERSALSMQVCLAQAYAANHQPTNANRILASALTNAYPANAQRIFIDAGEPINGMLHTTLAMLEDKSVTAFARAILRALPKHSTAPAEALSPQERRVLRLLTDGRSNAEIASELVVSVNTIKAHVKNLYRKLGVSNRIEAIGAAREFDLL